MKIKNCVSCGKEFEANTSGKYCSHECFLVVTRNKYVNNTKVKTCKICGEEFQGASKQINCSNCRRLRIDINYEQYTKKILCKYCGDLVKEVTKNKTMGVFEEERTAVCLNCKEKSREKMSERMKTDANPSIQKYGRGFHRKDFRVSEDQKLENRKSTSERMRKNNPMKNPEVVQKVFESLKKRLAIHPVPKGKENKNWKGNRDRAQTIRTRLYKLWVYPILERDGFKCSMCFQHGRLEVHHKDKSFKDIVNECTGGKSLEDYTIDEFEDIIEMVIAAHDNIDGITVCVECHRKIDPLRH